LFEKTEKKESNIDFVEIEEALIIVRQRKERNNNNDDDYGDSLQSKDEKIKRYQRNLNDLEAQLVETVGELDKSRHLLITQVKINEDYKKEVILIQNKMEENRAEYDTRTIEYTQLLEIRAHRIKKLERQLRDIAYGTNHIEIDKDIDDTLGGVSGAVGDKRRQSFSFTGAPTLDMLDNKLISKLERGQNIFEIHLTKLILTNESVKIMNEKDPSTFCTIEFFEHELTTTPVIKGQEPQYNFTSQYVIRVDDFFLHYLQKETTTIEFHQVVGSNYKTRAACQLSFRDLIDQQIPRLHGHANLICVDESNVGVSFGSLEYWVRLIVPVDESFRFYKQRTKSLGYLGINAKTAEENKNIYNNKDVVKARSIDNMNELNINILRCARINKKSIETDGDKKEAAQPSPYCVYKFFDFKDHDTEIISSSNYPEFNDHKKYPVAMDIDLDKYLKQQTLDVYVFDDNEDANGEYLGCTRIPLIQLSHDKDIKGTFELFKQDETVNGTIDVTMYWQYSYLPPSASTFGASGPNEPVNDRTKKKKKPEAANISGVQLLNGERVVNNKESSMKKAARMGVKLTPALKQQQQKQNQHHLYNDNKNNINEAEKEPSSSSFDPSLTLNNSSDNNIHATTDTNASKKANRTIHKKPNYVLPQITNSAKDENGETINSHLNDTMFGDEAEETTTTKQKNHHLNERTMSPTELDSLRDMYQKNATLVETDDENSKHMGTEEIEERIEEEYYEEEGEEEEEDDDEIDGGMNTIGGSKDNGFSEYNATLKRTNLTETIDNNNSITGTGIVEGNWDPNNTSELPKHGDKDNVIIEIASYALMGNSRIFERDDIQKIFVSMSFLNYNLADLEANSMPKPIPNEPVNFNFRKSNNLLFFTIIVINFTYAHFG
jgi:hypothetical protein